MSVSVFPVPATGGGGGAGDIEFGLSIVNGVTFADGPFETGTYTFTSSLGGTNRVAFFNAANEILVEGTSGGVFSLILAETAAYVVINHSNYGVGTITVKLSPRILKQVVRITSSTTYDLTFAATAYVLGGGGGGGSPQSGFGGCGGGSGYLSISAVAAGSYSVVIGAGGANGAFRASGSAGGTSSFGAISAAGGSPGLTTGTAGAGGSGGGGGSASAGTIIAKGGLNGADGETKAGALASAAGSGVQIPTPKMKQSIFQSTIGGGVGDFYAGGNGGEQTSGFNGVGAVANSGSGGGGARNDSGSVAGSGGSGVVYLVEV